MLYRLSYASKPLSTSTDTKTAASICAAGRLFTQSNRYWSLSVPSRQRTRAGDGARTRDIKLGRLALYQLSYSRDSPLRMPFRPSPACSLLLRPSLHMVGEGFEPSEALAGRFTVCSRWPLGYPTRVAQLPSPRNAPTVRRHFSLAELTARIELATC